MRKHTNWLRCCHLVRRNRRVDEFLVLGVEGVDVRLVGADPSGLQFPERLVI